MELKSKSKPAIIFLGCVLAVAVCCSLCSAEKLCTVSHDAVSIQENSTVDLLVANIDVDGPDVTLTVVQNYEDFFYLQGNELMVRKGLDYELLPSADAVVVRVQCSNGTDSFSVNVSVEVFVENVNDNPPNFAQNHYVLDVNELTPINTSVGLIEATDIDSDILYYRLESAMEKYFRLESVNVPKILVANTLDYDVIQKVSLVLHVQDTFDSSLTKEPFFSAVATITVNVKDVDNRPPWFQPCTRASLGIAKLCVSTNYKGRVNLTEKEDGPLALDPGPVFARDGDKNRSEQISYKILRGNEGSIFQIDEETGNISMAKAADIVGPITLTVLASQVTNRDQFAVTQVTIEVMRKSRNPPRFEKERYEGYIYSNSVPESMILRDRASNRPFRVRARDEDFASGVNPDVKYEVQYSSYVNVTSEGFIILKRVVKTESFALQLRAVDASTGEFGTSALSVQVIPAVAVPSELGGGYRAGDMALLGLVMAALLVLCLLVIGFLVSRLRKGTANLNKLSECLGPCLRATQNGGGPKDSMEYTNDGFQTEGDQSRGGGGGGGGKGGKRWGGLVPRRSTLPSLGRSRGVIPLERKKRHCSTCGVYTNHVANKAGNKGGVGGGTETGEYVKRSRKEGQKTVSFKEVEDSSEIEVEIIPYTVGQVQEEEEAAPNGEVEMDGVVRDPAAPRPEGDDDGGDDTAEPGEDQGGRGGDVDSEQKEESKEADG